jgi:tryptophan-rich sensory protein
MYNSIWYYELIKPKFTPPDDIFLPVWAVLYCSIFISLYFYIKAKSTEDKTLGYTYFSIQLLLNLLWSPIFFGLKNIFLAFLEIILLDIFIILTIKKFYTVSKFSGVILFPYLLWVMFATYLTFAYLMLN